jgi:head-tail adaptor
MRAGQLDRRLTIQRQGVADDPLYGPQPGGWSNFAERVPAQKWDLLPSDAEETEVGLRVANRPARVRIRYMRGVTPDMRVILHEETDEVYEITSTPAEIGRREWLEFTIRAYSS